MRKINKMEDFNDEGKRLQYNKNNSFIVFSGKF